MSGGGLVLICIPTCMRPKMLAACLESLAATKLPPHNEVRLLVLDNDALKGAELIFSAQKFPFAARYAVEPVRGLCAVRNRALDEAKAEQAAYLAFIDDDHVVDENWLCLLLEGLERSGADVISGRVEVKYPLSGKSWWMPAEKKERQKQNSPAAYGIRTNEKGIETAFTLMKARVYENMSFDMRFNLSGAEDYDYSLRTRARGFRLAATDKARAITVMPAERVRFWQFYRMQWQRQTGYVQSHKNVDGIWKSLGFLPKGLIKLSKGIIYCVIGLVGLVGLVSGKCGKRIFAKGLKNVIAGSGLCYGVFRHGNYQAYAKIKGE